MSNWLDDQEPDISVFSTPRAIIELITKLYDSNTLLESIARSSGISPATITNAGRTLNPENIFLQVAKERKTHQLIISLILNQDQRNDVLNLIGDKALTKVIKYIPKHNGGKEVSGALSSLINFKEIDYEETRGNEERILSNFSYFENPDEFIERLEFAKSNIVRIDVNGIGEGTGFLVGPDLILTAHHVVKDFLGEDFNLEVLFDFHHSRDGDAVRDQNKALKLDKKLIAWSALADKDNEVSEAGGDNTGTATYLDFALMKISSSSSQLLTDRGYYALCKTAKVYNPEENLTVIGHPKSDTENEAGPLKFSYFSSPGTAVTPSKQRLRYIVNTKPGNSGSPLFDARWNVVGLHHYSKEGQPIWDNENKWPNGFNQGVPMKRVVDEIVDQLSGENDDVLRSMGLLDDE